MNQQINKIITFAWEMTKMILLALLIVIPVRYFLFQPFIVRGASMEPNFYSNDYLIIDEISYRFQSPQRGDVVVFRYPRDPGQRFIKRVIGLPNETVEIKGGKLTVYDSQGTKQLLDESKYLTQQILIAFNQDISGDSVIRIGPDEYFVMGDNRPFSSDSRRWGTLPRENIIGKVFLRIFPFASLAKINTPLY